MTLKTRSAFWTIAIGLIAALTAGDCGATNIGDITRIHGSEENVITGMGLVVGLNGTGDGGDFAPAHRPLINLIQNDIDANAQLSDLSDSDSVALVYITARIGAEGARQGDMVDVTLSKVGPATSLAGGTLVTALLLGPGEDGLDYAVANGAVRVPDEENLGRAIIRNGAQMVRDIVPQVLDEGGGVQLIIDEDYASFSTAVHLAQAINALAPDDPPSAHVINQKFVRVQVPSFDREDPSSFITQILMTHVDYDFIVTKARITINRAAQTIAINGNVEVRADTISHNGFVFTIGQAAEPVEDAQGNVIDTRNDKVTLNDLIAAFRDLNLTVDSQIEIIETLKDNGSLIAEIRYVDQ